MMTVTDGTRTYAVILWTCYYEYIISFEELNWFSVREAQYSTAYFSIQPTFLTSTSYSYLFSYHKFTKWLWNHRLVAEPHKSIRAPCHVSKCHAVNYIVFLLYRNWWSRFLASLAWLREFPFSSIHSAISIALELWWCLTSLSSTSLTHLKFIIESVRNGISYLILPNIVSLWDTTCRFWILYKLSTDWSTAEIHSEKSPSLLSWQCKLFNLFSIRKLPIAFLVQ